MKKKLPRAITVRHDQMQAASALQMSEAPSPSAREDLAVVESERSLVQGACEASNVVPIKPMAEDAPPDRESGTAPIAEPVAAPIADSVVARRHRASALAIVNRYAAYSAAGGVIPIPVASFAGVTAVIVRMVRALCKHYGVPFERDRARAIVVALVGGAMPTGVAAVTSSALVYLVPPTALLTAAVSSMTAAAFTRSVGQIFIAQLEGTGRLEELSRSRK
jgi:uncharacterized protein (DUF697 family)